MRQGEITQGLQVKSELRIGMRKGGSSFFGIVMVCGERIPVAAGGTLALRSASEQGREEARYEIVKERPDQGLTVRLRGS